MSNKLFNGFKSRKELNIYLSAIGMKKLSKEDYKDE